MKSGLQFESHSDEETRALGRHFAKMLPDRGVVLLIGDLGAGKTTLAKGIVEGLGIARADDISSPTFTLIHEYGQPVGVYHIDLYRLNSTHEARHLGLEDLLDRPALVLVEWGERFSEMWPEDSIKIRLSHKGEENRIVEISGL